MHAVGCQLVVVQIYLFSNKTLAYEKIDQVGTGLPEKPARSFPGNPNLTQTIII